VTPEPDIAGPCRPGRLKVFAQEGKEERASLISPSASPANGDIWRVTNHDGISAYPVTDGVKHSTPS
jgi:hypothetical protein